MTSVVVSGVARRGLILYKEFNGLGLQLRTITPQCVLSSQPFRCQSRFTSLQSIPHHEKLQAALHVVQRACQLCLSVQSGMKQGDGQQLDKVDNTPVTVADFGVQALISLELGNLFPSIPLVGEENASQLRAEYETKLASGDHETSLVETVVEALTPLVSSKLDCETVLEAIDRGAQTVSTGDQYWVLDPIDGTRGFLRGGDALYVVGLALVVDGKPVLGVMGCPNVAFRYSLDGSVIQMATSTYFEGDEHSYQRGLIMAASLGGGCWVKPLSDSSGIVMRKSEVATPNSIAESWFCISDNEVWSATPLAHALEGKGLGLEEMQVVSLCCGSLCKYFALALGGVSAFLLQASRSTPLKVWDHASGVICISEAGGQVSDLEGRALENLVGKGEEFFTVEGGGIFASNKALRDLLLTEIRNRTATVGQ